MLTTTKAPANLGSFEAQSHGLCTRCLRFALGIAPPGRQTRFPLLSALRDGIGYPQDSNERFPSCFLHLFLLSQAFLTQCQPFGRHRHLFVTHAKPAMPRPLDARAFQRPGPLIARLLHGVPALSLGTSRLLGIRSAIARASGYS